MSPRADVRWFALNDYERLLVPDLQALGLSIATTGTAKTRMALVMNHDLAPSAWRYARRHRIPLISYIWDLPPFRLGSGRADPIVPFIGRLIALPRLRGRYLARRGYYSRLRFVAKHATAVWSPSAISVAAVADRFAVSAVRVPYCYDSRLFGAPPDTRAPDGETAAPREPFALLSVSRLVAQKNQEAVIRAAARLGARVELIGKGPREAALHAFAAQLGVPCRIRGGVPPDELVSAYTRASVVVCPSRFEGLGLTGIEGAVRGAPVVASDIPAHREFLGAAAHFFELDNDASLVDAIERAKTAGPPPTGQFASLTIGAAAQRFFDNLRPHL